MNAVVNRNLPYFASELAKGNIYKWDNLGITRELSEEDKKEIIKLETLGKSTNLRVIAVLDSIYDLEGDVVNMVSYVFVDQHSEPWEIQAGIVGVMAYVNNKTWDIQEAGSIGIYERIGLRRCM